MLLTHSPVKTLLPVPASCLEGPGVGGGGLPPGEGRGERGCLPSCAWRGIWEAVDFVLPLLFLLPWLARDGCVCNFRWALGPPRALLPARLALPSSEGWPEPFATSGVQLKGFP